MQKKLIALAIAGLASGAAFAQNNVTIYGVADVGVEYGNYGDGSKFRVQSGQTAGSRLGFKGEEALGNGLSAIWTLEMGVAFDNGATTTHTTNTAGAGIGGTANPELTNGSTGANSSSIFQRQAFAGLKSAQFGQVTFGRQYTPGFYAKAQSDAFGLGYTGTANNAWGKLGAFAADRLDNEVQYMTPTYGGFTGALGYSSGTETYNTPTISGTGSVTNATHVTDNTKKTGQTWGALATYSGYGANVALAYHDINAGPNGLDNSIKAKGWLLGGNYNIMNVATVYAGYATSKTTSPNTVNGAGGADGEKTAYGNVWNVGVKVPFGAHSVMAQYSKWNDKLVADADFTVWGLGYEYALSKRTALYAGYAHGTNKNGGTSVLNSATNTGIAMTDNSTVGSRLGYDPHAFNFGMRHSF